MPLTAEQIASSYTTLADLQRFNDRTLADVEMSDIHDSAPLIKRLAAVPSSNGTLHRYEVETGAPVVGFRNLNEGRVNTKASVRTVESALKILDAGTSVDRAAADADQNGKAAHIAKKAKRNLKAAHFVAEQQIINGEAEKGFMGLRQAMAHLDNEYVINAGGTTANAGSSIYIIVTNDEGSDVALVSNKEITVGETTEVLLYDEDGKPFDGYRTPVLGWLGLQIGSKTSLVRIANITEQAGKGATDDLVYRGLELLPSDKHPELILMSRRSRRQIRESRTATNNTGAPAPLPTDVEGIEIVTSDAVENTEPIATAA